MEAHNATTDGTPMNQNQFGHVFTLETTYDNNLQIRREFSDGSSSTFVFDPDYDYKVVRAGSDDTVMLKRVFNDGSTQTESLPTEWFESIRGALEPHF